ncbi:MAG: hypothetical protein RLY69_662 [Verrucomicrobiota bacterium]|jgi:hypothetical protein
MEFKLKAARIHPRHGLKVIDEFGRSFLCGEKITIAEEEGVVLFREIENEDCPYKVRYQYAEGEQAGTDNPAVLALTLKWLRGKIPSGKSWRNVALDD